MRVGRALGTALAAGGLLLLVGATAPGPAQAADADLVVMTRNLYLGADVSSALGLLPDLPAAAQDMWTQVAATDFTARVPVLASEAVAARPAVIGIQEATTWECRPSAFGGTTVVYDFTQQFLDATAAAGTPYVLASAGGRTALNQGYSIPAIPRLTRVVDPATFQPLFGTDEADCGFTIADALAVRADLAPQVLEVGTVEYENAAAIVPVLMEVQRGYAWADIRIGSTPVRFVTTHLEAFWKAGAVPASAEQARQLVRDLADVRMPLVVMGDFNSDPRDPRAPGDNPGGQPEATGDCPAQSGTDGTCSAYWTMVGAGYADSGPDATNPRNLSWGASGLLAGPDLERLKAAEAMGNPYGMTDRLDYVFTRNGVTASSARLVGNAWPAQGDTWDCTTEAQKANAAAAAAAMGVTVPASGACLPTDHAGVVASLAVPVSDVVDPALPERVGFPFTRWAVGLGVLALLALAVRGLVRRRRRRRAARTAE
ncbi:MAG: endonuclease/exonuclease/phosphatase family protein [Candidatus Nanopelagicales bacterium]